MFNNYPQKFGELLFRCYCHVVGSLVSPTLIVLYSNQVVFVLQLLYCIVNKGHNPSYLLPTSLIGSTECSETTQDVA